MVAGVGLEPNHVWAPCCKTWLKFEVEALRCGKKLKLKKKANYAECHYVVSLCRVSQLRQLCWMPLCCVVMLSVTIKAIMRNAIMLCRYAECRNKANNAKCHYANCNYAKCCNKANYAECHYAVSLCRVSQLRQLYWMPLCCVVMLSVTIKAIIMNVSHLIFSFILTKRSWRQNI